MSAPHAITDNIVYDLVSIQYHALQAVESYACYLDDAGSDDEVRQFVEQCRQQDVARAERCHELLKRLTADI